MANNEQVTELSKRSQAVDFNTEVITPKDAEAMLKTATNPKIDERAVDAYATAMASGGWFQNGQPIVFDENGSLMDGVQRLHAVVKTDTPIKTLVARNVRNDTYHTIDQHRRRNYAGVLESRGYRDAGSIVRTMSKLIKIENGALNRNPLPVSWNRYDRVLDSNPEILDAVAIAAELRGSALHSTPRPILIFQAIRAGKQKEVREFLEELSPGYEPSKITAATQARMRLGAWNNDPSILVDIDKVLGNTICYFNAYCEGKTLPDNFVWNPDLGRRRNAEGRWQDSDTVIRSGKVRGLSARGFNQIMGEEDISRDELVRLARRFMLRTPSKQAPDDDGFSLMNDDRMDIEAFNEFIDSTEEGDVVGLREKIRKEINKRLVEEAAPPNLGLPVVDGYQGLRNGKIDMMAGYDIEAGVVHELVEGQKANNETEVSARMIIVTPELAEKWLSQQINRHNRKIQPTHISAIARDIKNEEWMVNAQPISFTADPFKAGADDNLRLLNGQHRLRAVIEADTPIEVPIAINVREEAFPTFDVHAKRSVVTAPDRTDSRVLSAAARFQWKEDNGFKIMESSASPTATEIKRTLENHPGLAENFPRSRRTGMVKIASAGVLTYFFYRISRNDKKLAQDFMDDLEYGQGLDKGNPVRTAREDFLSDRGKMSRREVLSRLLSAWTAYKAWRGKSAKAAAKAAAAEEASDAGNEQEPDDQTVMEL